MRTRESANTTNGFPAARLGRGMAALAHDVTSIAELQAKLMAQDIKEGSRLFRRSVICAVLGGTLLLACLPVGLIGIAEVLVATAGWTEWTAYLVTSGAGILISGVFLWLCWSAIRQSAGTMRRSNEELARNVQWLKQALRREQLPD
jgi:hypothetical protein